jgi:O-antigen ligase
LLSETGLIGTALFVGGMLWVVLGGLERVRGVGEQESDAVHWKVLGLGLTASTVGIVFADLVRMGVYYDMVLWLSLALTAAVAHRIYSSQASA